MFRRTPAPPKRYRAPAGERIYAIGDVHGRLDCLKELLRAIDEDDRSRSAANTTLIFLGDLVDRGPESRGVVDLAMRMNEAGQCVFLMGNHEEIVIRAWEGERQAASLLHRVGGRETLLSYGVDAAVYDEATTDEVSEMVGQLIPGDHIQFMRSFRDRFQIGDYLFVHAGIKPGIALDAQDPADMRWIRREFLESGRDHGAMIVHGHTVREDVEAPGNRIGIDTGAFATGKLTAIGIEGDTQWFLTGIGPAVESTYFKRAA